MNLSEILWWGEKKSLSVYPSVQIERNKAWNAALKSCDHEIDREALHEIIAQAKFDGDTSFEITVKVIATMPMWLKRIKE